MNTKNITSTVLTVAIASALIIGGAYAYQNLTEKNQPQQNIKNGQDQAVNIPSDWKTTRSEALGISVSHPADVAAGHENGNLTLHKWGPTQVEGTEVYDGMVLNFDKSPLSGKAFEQAVNAEVEDWKVHGEIVKSLSTLTMAGKNAYSFVGSGLGQYTIYFIELNGAEYLRVSTLVEDPKSQGFQTIADTILKSLNIQ
jgi:hypothetical protein